MQLLHRFRITVVMDVHSLAHAASLIDLARTYNLSVYDAAYIELAMRTGYPLATINLRQQAAATDLGVAVVS